MSGQEHRLFKSRKELLIRLGVVHTNKIILRACPNDCLLFTPFANRNRHPHNEAIEFGRADRSHSMVRFINHESEILERRDDRPQRDVLIGCIESACLDGPKRNLTFIR